MTTILVTGANRGIGLELCRIYKEQGCDVIATCRQSGADLDALAVRVETGVEVSDPDSINQLASSLAGVTLDILINNAGIMTNETLDAMDPDAINRQFAVNTLGPVRIVRALLPNLANPSKLVFITSRMGSIADNGSGGYYGYRMSKAALNMAGVSLAHDLHDRGVAVAILHPGFVQTDLTGNAGDVTPDVSAANLIGRIGELSLDNTGAFRHANGDALDW